MDPIFTVVRFGELERPIGNFGILLAVAMLVCAAVATRASHRAGLDAGSAVAACGFGAAGSLVGASVLYYLVEAIRKGSISGAFETQGIVFYGAEVSRSILRARS